MTEPITWTPERRKVRDLKNWERNPRKISKEAFEKLKERITKRGFHDIVKIDTDGTILSGNQRKHALEELGVKEVTVLVPSRALTEEEREKVALESNRSDGEWSWDDLANFDEEVLRDIGFTEEEMKLGFGLSTMDEEELDPQVLQVLTVEPPESPRLKERATIHCDTIEQYERIKKAVEGGKVTAADVEKMIQGV